MKFTTTKKALREAIETGSKAVNSKTTLPILSGLLLNLAGNELKVTGSNLEITISALVDVVGEEDGSIVIDAKQFDEFTSKLPDGNIYIETTEDHCIKIQYGLGSLATLKGMSPDQYPGLPAVNKEQEVKIKAKEIKSMLRQALPAVATDETRPILTGVLIEMKDKKLTCVALDGFRMIVASNTVDCDSIFRLVMQGKHVASLVSVLGTEEEVTVAASKTHIVFEMGGTKIISRLLEGEFVNYRQIIPADSKVTAKFKVSEFMESLSRVSIISAGTSTKHVLLNVSSDGHLSLKANSDMGNAYEEIKAETNGDLEIAFSSKYLMDMMKSMDDEECEFHFTTEVSPAVVYPAKNKDMFTGLVLPTRIKPQAVKAGSDKKAA